MSSKTSGHSSLFLARSSIVSGLQPIVYVACLCFLTQTCQLFGKLSGGSLRYNLLCSLFRVFRWFGVDLIKILSNSWELQSALILFKPCKTSFTATLSSLMLWITFNNEWIQPCIPTPSPRVSGRLYAVHKKGFKQKWRQKRRQKLKHSSSEEELSNSDFSALSEQENALAQWKPKRKKKILIWEGFRLTRFC